MDPISELLLAFLTAASPLVVGLVVSAMAQLWWLVTDQGR
jgi:hypothetical protein